MSEKLLNIVLLTATVTPPKGVKNLARTDITLRLRDYLDAFEFYLEKVRTNEIDRLIFCDNSGNDLTTLRERVLNLSLAEHVEIISFFGLDYPPEFGRGYGEFKLVDYAMKHSKLIGEAPPSANIWKITGRYKLINIRAIIERKKLGVDFYCNCRNFPVRWLDLYVLAWNKFGYNEIVNNIYEKLKEVEFQTSSEIEFRKELDCGKFKSKIIKRFNVVPILEGHRGLDNAQYSTMKWKYLTRNILNNIFPWLWI